MKNNDNDIYQATLKTKKTYIKGQETEKLLQLELYTTYFKLIEVAHHFLKI